MDTENEDNKITHVQSALTKKEVRDLKHKTHESSIFFAIQKAIREYLKDPRDLV